MRTQDYFPTFLVVVNTLCQFLLITQTDVVLSPAARLIIGSVAVVVGVLLGVTPAIRAKGAPAPPPIIDGDLDRQRRG